MLTTNLLIALLVLILLLPYAWGYTTDFLGRRSGWWRSVLYRYRYGPGFEHSELDGLRRLQTWMLLILGAVIRQLQPELVAWFVAVIRRVLGW
ncbi:MAG: hypothetical protein WCP31_06865 [Chloroflexales bacterium]